MNRKLVIAAAVTSLFNLPLAYAEIPQGFSVYGSAAFVGSSTKFTSGSDSFDGFGTDDTSFDLGAEYSFGTENSFAIGAKYLTGFEVANWNSDSTVKIEDGGGYAFYVSPRVKIGDSTLLTGTIGMFQTDGKITTDGTAAKGDLEGNYYGFGVRHYLDGNNFIEVGMERFNYDALRISSVDLEGSATKALITYGVTF